MKHLSRLLVRSTMGAVLLTLVLVGTASAHTLTPHVVPGPQTPQGVAARPGTFSPLRSSLSPLSFCCSGAANIFNEKSGRCIGIGSNLYAGDWTCTNNNDQLWYLTNCAGLYCNLENENNQCLGVAGGSTQEGARIQGYRCDGTSNQLWNYNNYCVSGPHSFQQFLENFDGYVIGVQGASTANGAPLIQYAPNTSTDQCWSSELFPVL